MDREGFRNRLKQYKLAREENPGLKYWEWKDIPKYDEGGKVIPTQEEYIAEQIAARKAAALEKSLSRTMPRVPQGIKTGERWNPVTKKVEDIHECGPSCAYTFSDNYGLNWMGSEDFKQNHANYGWKQVPWEQRQPGNAVLIVDDSGTAKHTMMYDSDNAQGQPLFNHSNGGHDESAIRKKAKYPHHNPYLTYEFVGTPADSIQWINDYKKIYGFAEGTDGIRDNTYVAPIEKELVFIPATGSTKLKLDILRNLTRNNQIKSGAVDIVSPEFDILTGARAIATLPSKAEKLGRVLSNSDIAAPQISIQPNNVIYQSPIKEKVKTISYGKAKTLASDFVTGSPYENIMGKVVSVDRGPWKSKIGVNSDQFGKYIGNGSESTVFMANDDPNFVYKILTTNVPTPLDAKDYLSVIYSNRNKVPAALQHKLIGFVKNGEGFNPVMRLKRVNVLDQKDNKTLLEKALPQIDEKMNRSGYNRYADTQYFNDKNNIEILDIKPENVGQLENGNYTLLDFLYLLRAEQIPIKSIVSDIFSKWGKSYADGGEVTGPPTYEQWYDDMIQYNPTILDNASLYWSLEAAKKDLHKQAMDLPGYAPMWHEYVRSLPKADPDINQFVDDLWANENPNNVGYRNGKYYPHKSPEGGKMTIGPGFKLDSGSHGISTKTANRGMTKTRLDQEARKIGKQHLKAVDRFINYGQTTNPADTVSPQIKMGLMDLRHQVGPLNEWGNLRQAVLNGDLEGIRKESTVTWNDNGKTKVDKRRKKIRDEKYFYYE